MQNLISCLKTQNKTKKKNPAAANDCYWAISAPALTWKLCDSPGRYSDADTQAFCEEEKTE